MNNLGNPNAASSHWTLVPLIVIACGIAWLIYQSGALALWTESEEYGHGIMVLGLLGYIVYVRRHGLLSSSAQWHWLSVPAGLLALVFAIAGASSGIGLLSMYAIWLSGIAVILLVGGSSLLRRLLVPMLIILLLIPLPQPLGPQLTAQLQLISSKLGVWFIRTVGGSVYLEGNVIDMGTTKLLVAEACAGLRYLFPLMSIGAIIGFILKAPLWMRWLVFLATVPITIFMNSLRIGVTGILTEKWGPSHTEGVLHFFEGWVVFIIATVLLIAFLRLLLIWNPGPKQLQDALSIEGDGAGNDTASFSIKPALGWTVALLVGLTTAGYTYLATMPEAAPTRKTLDRMPEHLGEWEARQYRLPIETEQVAGASEYFMGDFTVEKSAKVNVYIAYYDSQREGEVPHSPKVCIPGDGWVITQSDLIELQDGHGRPFTANRLVMEKEKHRMVAFYWLKQGSKMFHRNLDARLDLVRFFLTQQRTDGALIRLVTELAPEETLQDANQRLTKFSGLLLPVVPEYVPD